MPFEEKDEKEEEFSIKRFVSFILGKEYDEKPITQEEIDKERERLTSEIKPEAKTPTFTPYSELFHNNEVRISKPGTIEDCNFLIEKIKEGKAIIVDFSELENRQASIMYYYLCGACFSIEGHVKKISGNICLFAGKETMII